MQEETKDFNNNSGQGAGIVIPQEVKRFNWGAFCLTWIWGLFNKTYITLIVLGISAFVAITKAITGISFVKILNIFSIFFAIWFGIKGNEWAWQNKKWNSLKHFHDVQKKWAIGGITVLTIFIVLFVVGVLLALIVPILMNNPRSVEGYSIRKSITMTMVALNGTPAQNCDLSSNGLAECAGRNLAQPVENNRIMIGRTNSYLEFTGDGGCTNPDACYITIVTPTVKERVGLNINEEGNLEANQEEINNLIRNYVK